MPNRIPKSVHNKLSKYSQGFVCSPRPLRVQPSSAVSQPAWEFRGTAAWRALWHRSSSDPSLSLALAPSCCSPRQGDVTGDTSRC